MDAQDIALDNLIFYSRAGSHAYGLATESSDMDFRGVFVGRPENVIGFHHIEQVEGPYNGKRSVPDMHLTKDRTVFELRKFVKLAMECNPNLIELLYVDDSDILVRTTTWERLRGNRHLFLSKKAKHTFSGYAHSQLQRIQTHYKWITDPQPREAPDPSDAAAYKDWRNYWEWRRTRNADRSELEDRHGFDTKHAMHLVRLYRMGREILADGEVRVRRPDRDELLAIRNGEWTYERLLAYVADMDAEYESLYESSPLQHRPDTERIQQLMLEIYAHTWKGSCALSP